MLPVHILIFTRSRNYKNYRDNQIFKIVDIIHLVSYLFIITTLVLGILKIRR